MEGFNSEGREAGDSKDDWKEYRKSRNQSKAKKEEKPAGNGNIFTPAKSKAEALTYAKEHIGENVSLNSIDNLESLNQINSTITAAQRDYQLPKYKTVGFARGNVAARANETEIYFNSKYMNDPSIEHNRAVVNYESDLRKAKEHWDKAPESRNKKRALAELADLARYKRYTVSYDGTFVADTANHEIGHSLVARSFRNEYDKAGYREVKIGSQVKKYSNLAYSETQTYKTMFSAYNKAMGDGDIFKISKYADKNIDEFFSECFAVYRAGKEQLPQYIIDMIKEITKI